MDFSDTLVPTTRLVTCLYMLKHLKKDLLSVVQSEDDPCEDMKEILRDIEKLYDWIRIEDEANSSMTITSYLEEHRLFFAGVGSKVDALQIRFSEAKRDLARRTEQIVPQPITRSASRRNSNSRMNRR
eukprot:IDg14703t1